MVVLVIVAALMAVMWPILGRTLQSIRVHMGSNRVLVGMQTSAMLARENRRSDLDSSEPRVVGATYTGTALVFDPVAHKAWYCLNQQSALDPSKAITDPNRFWEVQADPDQPPLMRKAYQRMLGEELEHVDLPESLVYYGVGWDAATRTLTLLKPPFAICASASGNGLPPRKNLYVDLRDGGGFRKVPTSLPWVVVAPNKAGLGIDPADLDLAGSVTESQPNAVGPTQGLERIRSLIHRAGGQLISVAINGSAKI